MGYTHYYYNIEFTPVKWDEFKKDVKVLLDTLPSNVKIDSENAPAIIQDPIIWFNGVGEDGHESFVLRQENGHEFTKTNEKPYDLAVCGVLILASFHAHKGSIGSDGIGETYFDTGWKDAWEWVVRAIPATYVDLEQTFKLFRQGQHHFK